MQQTQSTMSGPNQFFGQTAAKIVLPNRPAAMAQLSEWLQVVAGENELPARCAFRLELVLTETVTNIIDHAYPPNTDGMITVLLTCEPGYIIAQIDDTGRPFDPTAAPVHSQPRSLEEASIGGLGLHLIRSYIQHWEYRRINQRNHLYMKIACDG